MMISFGRVVCSVRTPNGFNDRVGDDNIIYGQFYCTIKIARITFQYYLKDIMKK